ncbi:YckD family protein [Calderihabitans maritimus]|uniref:DUF2680 domain-containing protein n=1 Tax=Calderihabitans maritimus TaxID=1246530 RepID=A0A1Z5HRA4_9FIRM|nr:YckD family protein [Calderihabitans maritimus]GAW91800.1 hypothetical protein TherJR_2286 [Calderihabitans maritimus]
MKKIAVVLLVLILASALVAPAALAAITDQQKQDILQLFQQIVELRKQIVDKYVEAGELTPEQGEFIKDRIDNMAEFRIQNGILPGYGRGFGPGPWGCGMWGGYPGKGMGWGYKGLMPGGYGIVQ